MSLTVVIGVAALLFGVGLYGVLSQTNAVMIVMGVELMLGAAMLNVVGFLRYAWPEAVSGSFFVLVVMTLMALEAAVGFARSSRACSATAAPPRSTTSRSCRADGGAAVGDRSGSAAGRGPGAPAAAGGRAADDRGCGAGRRPRLGAARGSRRRRDRAQCADLLPAADLDVGLRLDGLSAVMSATVATVGAAVLVYASGYFADDERGPSALAGLLAFLAAMQGLVLAEGFLTLLIFWELVGALSARLIAFNCEDAGAPAGAVRAFLTTRAADVGFYLAVLALFAGTGSLAFDAERPDGSLGAFIGLGLVLAAMGKSAQAPLQTWLTGAMAGPTPVSALLHSATMVAAGVYLLARSHELLAGWPLELAGWVGAVTAVVGAAVALAQDDLKRVLAGSTTSQLGLMFVGVAAGGPAVALFHLVAHAAGKATLFLAAGVFQHNRHTTALRGLAGAGRDDRRAFALFVLGALSIAAVPPLAGFWSKDAIAVAAEEHPAWFACVLLSAAGSAAYLLRPRSCSGDPRPSPASSHAPGGRSCWAVPARWLLGRCCSGSSAHR